MRFCGTSWAFLTISFIFSLLIHVFTFIIMRESSLAETWAYVLASLFEVGVIPETVTKCWIKTNIFEFIITWSAALRSILCGFCTIIIFKLKWTINTDLLIFLATVSTRIFSTRLISKINATNLLTTKWLQSQEAYHLLLFILVTEVAVLVKIFMIYIKIHFVLINLWIVILAILFIHQWTVQKRASISIIWIWKQVPLYIEIRIIVVHI